MESRSKYQGILIPERLAIPVSYLLQSHSIPMTRQKRLISTTVDSGLTNKATLPSSQATSRSYASTTSSSETSRVQSLDLA